MDQERTDIGPPRSHDAEMAVLGCVLLDGSAMDLVTDMLDENDFYGESHRGIFRAMKHLALENKPIDAMTVFNALDNPHLLDNDGGMNYLLILPNNVATATNVRHYLQIVHDKAVLRRLLDIMFKAQHTATGNVEDVPGFIDGLNQEIFSLNVGESRQAYYGISEVVRDTFLEIEQRYNNRKAVTGVTTGFIDLDKKTSGFQKGDLIILAARPSMGKTALALNFLANASIDAGVPSVFFSLEMSRNQIASRVLYARSKVNARSIQDGSVADHEWTRLIEATGLVSESPIFIDDTPALPIAKLQAKCRRLKAEKNIGLIVVDYLQLMHGSGSQSSREQEISEISRSLKAIAKELEVPVIALSQLNRGVDSRTDKRPMLSDLRESGAIEQDADVIFFIYRDEVYNKESPEKGIAEVIVAKHRNGEIGTVKLRWFGQYTLFESLAENSDGNPFA